MTPTSHKPRASKGRSTAESRVPDVRRRQLLALLADGNFRSGEQLARDLRVTRSAVWKLIGKLRALGVSIEAAPRLGYRLPGPVQLYDARKIKELVHAETRRDLQGIETLLAVDSTNRYLADLPSPVPGQLQVCVAEMQTAGRGRRGRSWLAPFGSGICLSLAWQFEESPPEFAALSLAIGVAIVRALRRFGGTQIQLKWPNDLVAGHRKLGGILIDMRGEASGPARVVVGVGLNLRLPATTKVALAEQYAALTVDLQELLRDKTPDRNELIASILDETAGTLRVFAQRGFAAYAQEWQSFDSLRDHPVRVLSANEVITGIARGVAADGALIVEVGGQLRQFTSGDVSLRPAASL